MTKATGAVVLPRLNLSVEDTTELTALAAALAREITAQFESYVDRNRQLDRAKWRLLKTEGDVSAFQECRSGSDQLGFMSSSPRKSKQNEPQASLAQQSPIRRMLITGKMRGTLDDAMYGCSFEDTPSLRTKESYHRDFLDDSAVLATIELPTNQDPYRFLGVTWHLRSSRLTKNRDCLLLQSTRLATLSSGERIGLNILHSITHRGLPELVDFATTRIVMSSATIYRQFDLEYVEVFGINFLDDKRALGAVNQQESVRDILVSAEVGETAFKRKLHWLMRRRHSRPRPTDGMTESDHKHCALCTKPTTGLFAASGASCQLCSKHVCSRCTMTHEIIIDTSTSRAVAKPFGFCIECILLTKKTPTFQVAQDEAQSKARVRKSHDHLTPQHRSPERRRIDSSPLASW